MVLTHGPAVRAGNSHTGILNRLTTILLRDIIWYRHTVSGYDYMIDRDFFLGFIKIHILYHASEGPVFGVWLVNELARHGYNVSPGTMYPTLHRLQKDGYLKSTARVVNGKVRKYYRTSKAGKIMLKKAKQQIEELVSEVLEEK